ncbi:hypothetical protein C7974DRAFT_308831, partial [Boeremia exigua]|uniref:uncharacterized protein n=1 Tax=Boeremia exigua TaxID=749465 RepID=UPI001E8D52FB
MSKRSAPSSPTEEHPETKRPKLPDTQEATSPPLETVNNTPSPLIENIQGDSPQSEPPVKPDDKPVATKEKKNKKETKRKAGDGFAPWKPKPAYIDIPELQPHWGIVPRPGTYERPSHPQPSATTSEGAIRPALWEDRKGSVRLKRGSRYINGYDQAFHMWLPLMDVRPISSKDQKPRRVPVGYYYPHGMPIVWNDTGALNDVNKALQEAIKSKSNKEAPFNQVERGILAKIFSESPDISMLDAAEQFNERAYPITAPESGRYPSGRFTESIQHEFRIYQSSYIKGQAPT